jgi:hypothetical protein
VIRHPGKKSIVVDSPPQADTGMTDSVMRSELTRTEDYHKVYIMPNAKFPKTAIHPLSPEIVSQFVIPAK